MSLINNFRSFHRITSRLLKVNQEAPINFKQQMRFINLDKLSNKRITRLESDIELEDTKDYKSRVINRNPRNLEQLAYEKKPSGFWLDKEPPKHWNSLVFEQKDNHLEAYLQHWSGKKLVKASTSEPQLLKYFSNPGSTQAAMVLAQVISRRCLQGGFLCAGTVDDIEKLGSKSVAFYDEVKNHGFTLEEPSEITPRALEDV